MNKQRISAVLGLIGEFNSVADIGCDHGKIALALALKSPQSTVFATDISMPSLEKAKTAGDALNVTNVTYLCGDGFSVLDFKPDAAIIAGMGGDAIAEIIKHKFAQTRLVLQPMKDSDVLYAALISLGFAVERVVIAREDRRFYEVIAAEPGAMPEFNYILPPVNALQIDNNAVEFLKKKLFVFNSAMSGAENNDFERFSELKKQADYIREVLTNVTCR